MVDRNAFSWFLGKTGGTLAIVGIQRAWGGGPGPRVLDQTDPRLGPGLIERLRKFRSSLSDSGDNETEGTRPDLFAVKNDANTVGGVNSTFNTQNMFVYPYNFVVTVRPVSIGVPKIFIFVRVKRTSSRG